MISPFKLSCTQAGKGAEGILIVKVFGILGQEIDILFNERLKPGTYETAWCARNNRSGIYFISNSDPFEQTTTNKFLIFHSFRSIIDTNTVIWVCTATLNGVFLI